MSKSDLNAKVNVGGSITSNTVHTVISRWLMQALSPRVKWPGLEAHHSAAFSTNITNK
jgi:hypothetical protein